MSGALSLWMRRAGLWLAALALLLKVAAPAGFMLAPDSHDRLTMTICTGHGPVLKIIDLTSGKSADRPDPARPDKQNDKNGDLCPFAAAAAVAAHPTAMASLAAPLRTMAFLAPAQARLRASPAQAGPPHPARGPPHRA
ncbi:MAG TPA: DUF2946 family protein [Caulobacterales bacterium]|nr:DUF2946 family protein [Caulobacterales bacterium]